MEVLLLLLAELPIVMKHHSEKLSIVDCPPTPTFHSCLSHGLPPAQGLRNSDPPTSAKGQPAAALVLPESTDQGWDKKVSDLFAAQGGPSPKGFKDLDLLVAFNGGLTPDTRSALMVLIQHWYQGCGKMNITHADIHKILPVGDGLRGLV